MIGHMGFGKPGRRACRRQRTGRKLLQRLAMMGSLGRQSGLLYEKHRKKIDRSPGYMRDGSVTHYVQAGFGTKTRDRNRYGHVLCRSPHDRRFADAAEQQLQDLNYAKKKEGDHSDDDPAPGNTIPRKVPG